MLGDSANNHIEKKDILFHIEKLSCAYNNNKVVLEANNIIIPKRKITVLLGPSGAGKSTLLETLGLMTRTVDGETSSIKFYPTSELEYNLANMWGDHQESDRYNIRMLYYSFIFQSTNLMPNFSALENVGLTELIQNKPESEAYFNAIESLVKNLSVTSLAYEKKPFEFSGGERQRLAFARAINPEFTVLFGDEPTGNLDHFNSVKLMHFIRDFITKQRDNVSAIIVSHNIPLTLDFADRIIVLSTRDNGISTIDPHFIFDRDELKWYESNEKQNRIQQEIELLLNSDTESYVRILMHLSENKIDGETFESIKNRMVEHQNRLSKKDGEVTDAEKNAFKDWLTAFVSEKEISTPVVKEYIRQFSVGEIKKADIKINDVIRTIQDLKFKTAVEGHRDKKRKRLTGIEEQELGHSRAPIASILAFFPWMILSLAPLFAFVVGFFVTRYHKLVKRFSGLVNKKIKAEEESIAYSPILRSLKNIVHTIFYNLCFAWDWINIRYRLFLKINLKQNWVTIKAIPHDFKHLFYRNETKELLGKKNKNFWLIVAILFFTFLAIGFSNGSLLYLKGKMEDPFVRSINAPVAASNRVAARVIALYNTDSLKQVYRYDTIVGYNKWTAFFQGDLPESPNRSIDGRSIPYNDPLVTTIVDPNINHAIGSAFMDENDISVIVTRNLLDRLECSDDPVFIYRKHTDGRLIPIPIRAIVDKLPGERVEFIATQYFYNNHQGMGTRFLFSNNKRLYAYLVADTTHIDALKEASQAFFDRYWAEGGMLELNMIDVYKHQYTYKPTLIIQVSFYESDNIEMDQIDELYKQFRESDEIREFMNLANVRDHQFIQGYFPNLENSRNRGIDYIAVNFNDLSKVEVFAKEFGKDADIELEMSKIEQMKNYNFVSKLTTIMSLILIGFSVLMINIFLSNILSTHLNKIKMNIGTFKAFGIDIKRIYLGMMYIYVLLPIAFALVMAAIVGHLGVVYFIINAISPFEVEKNLYFDLFNQYTLISVVIMALVNYYAFSVIINRIFKQTPGDLIYDRNNKA
jgi:lipoprotein-releasing system ATP-binding protein